MIGQALAHYRITAAIGAGAMGEVYRATDTKLGRDVALKVLPAKMASNPERLERFQREARALAALDHPGIVTVHSVEEADGVHFLTMQLVAGQSLDRIIPENGLAAERILEIGVALSEALDAAHEKGIVHRDLKPSNVMVTDDGRVKVLDFGLARMTGPQSESPASSELPTELLTREGVVMGTVPYMSPEQVSGREVDHRSDLFSLGVILYEMASGERPFQGSSTVELASAILRDPPRPLHELRRGLPSGLVQVIEHCLEKTTDNRLPSAQSVLERLRSTSAEAIPAEPTEVSQPGSMAASAQGAIRADEGFWVAVLPLRYTGDNAEVRALAEGLSEEIVTGLSRFSYLRVIARSSTDRYSGEAVDIRSVGKGLGASYAIEGSLRQAGQALRIAVQLVDARSGAQMWAETYDRAFRAEEVFALQDELVPRIVSTVADMNGALPRSMMEAVRSHDPERSSPYEAVLRSFAYLERATPEELEVARSGLEAAVRTAPAHSEAWAMLAYLCVQDHAQGFDLESDSLQRGLAAAQRAVEVGPTSHLAHFSLAQALFHHREYQSFSNAAERAVALNPMDGNCLALLGEMLTYAGERERGLSLAERAKQLNPNFPGWYWYVDFFDAYGRGDDRRALDFALKVHLPGHWFAHASIAAACGQLGERRAAERALRDLLLLRPDFAATGREDCEKWWQPEYVERLIDGWRKAGLEGLPAAPVDPEPRPAPEGVSRIARHTVGRESELEALQAALEAARAGRGSLVCLAGEPGIGKTTLVERFLAEATANGGCTVARGRCSERLAGSDAYLPVLEALDSLLQASDGATAARVMKQVAPAWYVQIAPLSDRSDESLRLLEEAKAVTQERLMRDFVACVQELSRAGPLIVFLDDLHWADVSTVDLLSFLASKFDGSNVLVVVTYRVSDMRLADHSFLQVKPDLQSRGLCRELLLEFLQESEIEDYLALEFPDHSFPRELSALVHAKTEGSPLFMADLVRYLRDQGAFREVDGHWKLEQGMPQIERDLPESVLAMIERKIGQLSEEDHELLTAASVQGYLFDSAVVAGVLDLEADDVEERLDHLERFHAFVKLVSETELPDHTLSLRYRFVHVLYQNELYAALRATRKATLSRQVGQALERLHGEKAPGVAHELAALYEVGRDFARAAECYLLAAEQASSVFADREAATLASQGIGMLDKLEPSPDRARRELELQLALGQALRTTKGFGHPDTGKAYARARELCHDVGEAPQLFPILFGFWEFCQNQGDLEAAIEVAEQMLALAESANDSGLLVAAHGAMADNLLCVGAPGSAREHAAQAIALYDQAEHHGLASLFGYDSGVAAHCMMALALWQSGYPDRAVKSIQAASDLAEDLSHPATLAFIGVFSSWIQNLRGALEEARQQAERCVEVSTEFEIPTLLAFGWLVEGWASIARGDVEAGTARARAGLEGLEAAGFRWARTFCLGVVAQGCAGAGRTHEALALLEEALADGARTGERFYEAELLCQKGECLLSSSKEREPLEGERYLLRAIEVARSQQAKSWELRATTTLARHWFEQGRAAEAHVRLEPVYSWFTEGFDTPDLEAAQALLSELAEE